MKRFQAFAPLGGRPKAAISRYSRTESPRVRQANIAGSGEEREKPLDLQGRTAIASYGAVH